jgi:esterase/lipase
MKPDKIEIPTLGYSLAADWYEGRSNEVLLVLVGYSSNKKNYEDIVSYIVEHTDTSALVLDYSGHGESPFELRDVSPAQNFLEVIKAFDWIKQNHPNKVVNVMGTSYGGFLAVQLTKYREFNNLVLRVPAIYKPSEFYTPWSVRIDNEERYIANERTLRTDVKALQEHPLLARAADFKGHTFVVVHEFDELVPKETTDAYIEVFKAESYLAKNFPHSFRQEAPDLDKLSYKRAISDWLSRNS